MRPRGTVRLYYRNVLIWQRDNIFVNAGLPALANLIAGVTAGQYVTAIGYGSGNIVPSAADTSLSPGPAYYNAIGAHSFPSSGSVQFNYALLTSDYGASGITIQELGLFANSGSVALPVAQSTSNPSWLGNTATAVNSLVIDSNGNLQRCTTPGTTGNAAPVWSTALNGTTNDGSVVWTLAAFHQAPAPMIAHVSVPAFAYTGAGNYSGTWTLTF
jgi:hypothetical protein